MEASLYGVYFENKKEMYLPSRGIKVPVLVLGESKGYEIDIDNCFNGNSDFLGDMTFRHLKLLTGKEIVTAKHILIGRDGFELESILFNLLDRDARDAILVLNGAKTRVDRVYDSTANKDKTWGHLLEGFLRLHTATTF